MYIQIAYHYLKMKWGIAMNDTLTDEFRLSIFTKTPNVISLRI